MNGAKMLFSEVVDIFEKIESTSKRLEITDLLVSLFNKTPNELVDKLVYLTQGKLYPDFEGIELGLAEKMAIKALSQTSGFSESKIYESWIKEGDIGLVAQQTMEKKKQTSLFSEPLTLEMVYAKLDSIARASGAGAQSTKIAYLSELLNNAKPLEAKYIIRLVVGKLRLGIADMTVLDALAQKFLNDRTKRVRLEHPYNICSDLGLIARTLVNEGEVGLEKIKMKPGIPLRPMLAERLDSIKGILEKLGGRAAFEFKYDGLRVQAHIFENGKIQLYSRQLENITAQFPDIQEELRKSFKCKSGIIEGECIPVNLETGEMRPFQEVSHRRGRKYDLEDAVEEYPVTLILFDCLLLDGIEYINKPYLERRKALENAISYGGSTQIFSSNMSNEQLVELENVKNEKINETKSSRVRLSQVLITDDVSKAEEFFERSIESGCEGIVAKSIAEDSVYRAGARGWLWIKFKRDYRSEMTDSVDLVIVGAFAGQGRRAGTYGAILMAAYNEEKDRFETVCKLGTGFDDAFLAELPKRLERLKLKNKDKRVFSKMECDYWFEPLEILEVVGAEITLSPIHTCGLGLVRENAGLAIRFPRYTGKWRSDKKGESATTTQEIVKMYDMQLKKK